jgi:hypothetical protein
MGSRSTNISSDYDESWYAKTNRTFRIDEKVFRNFDIFFIDRDLIV